MVNKNGTLVVADEATLDAANRGLHYGDAVFETIKVSAGKIFFWEDHYFRLMASMRILRMEIPMTFTLEFLEEEIMKTLAAQPQKADAYRIKLLVWRSWGGKYTPVTRDVEYLVFPEALEQPFYTLNDAPYEVELFKDHYVNSGLLLSLIHI